MPDVDPCRPRLAFPAAPVLGRRPRAALLHGLALGLTAALVLTACDAREEVAYGTPITVLVAYTPAVRARDAQIERHVAEAFTFTNEIYRTGNIPVRLVPVRYAQVSYTEGPDRRTALARLLDPRDGPLDEVHVLRDQAQADLVVLVVDQVGGTINASILATPETAFIIVHMDDLLAPKYSLAHEIGHLQGARHAFNEDGSTAPFAYGHGFRNDSLMTVMAGGGQKRAPVFSGPDQTYHGSILGDAATADNARVLRETAVYLSNFRGPQTPTGFVPSGTWPTLTRTGTLTLAACRD